MRICSTDQITPHVAAESGTYGRPEKGLAESLRFPAGVNDDQVDALSLLGRMLAGMAPALVPKEPEEPRYDRTIGELFEAHDRIIEGRIGHRPRI